ncbi:MAG: tRNA (cytidine(34)-2'-O)-methyltransferase [Spirochaetia bacterium]|jgi:tRNA (cytidine/uridine-2'-O-)-methyltransferase|nr:tRNA (cytidine(34)-2'-O)-methyltransferase [Spirochaetia bacterium]
MPLNIVLVEPEIPQNTGNIARTCAAAGAVLHLIEPLGFSIGDKYLKRAGLDYWNLVDVRTYGSLDQFFAESSGGNFFYITTKAEKSYTEADIPDGSYLLFGKETKGLPEELLKANYGRCIRIPMVSDARSLNISNAAAIVLYDALRRLGFPGLKADGKPGHF